MLCLQGSINALEAMRISDEFTQAQLQAPASPPGEQQLLAAGSSASASEGAQQEAGASADTGAAALPCNQSNGSSSSSGAAGSAAASRRHSKAASAASSSTAASRGQSPRGGEQQQQQPLTSPVPEAPAEPAATLQGEQPPAAAQTPPASAVTGSDGPPPPGVGDDAAAAAALGPLTTDMLAITSPRLASRSSSVAHARSPLDAAAGGYSGKHALMHSLSVRSAASHGEGGSGRSSGASTPRSILMRSDSVASVASRKGSLVPAEQQPQQGAAEGGRIKRSASNVSFAAGRRALGQAWQWQPVCLVAAGCALADVLVNSLARLDLVLQLLPASPSPSPSPHTGTPTRQAPHPTVQSHAPAAQTRHRAAPAPSVLQPPWRQCYPVPGGHPGPGSAAHCALPRHSLMLAAPRVLTGGHQASRHRHATATAAVWATLPHTGHCDACCMVQLTYATPLRPQDGCPARGRLAGGLGETSPGRPDGPGHSSAQEGSHVSHPARSSRQARGGPGGLGGVPPHSAPGGG